MNPSNTSSQKKHTQFDLNIFKQENIDNNNNNCKSIQNCVSLKKLSESLKYYSSIDIINNASHRETFSNFMMQIYHTFLDDYTHLIDHHSNHLNQIYMNLIKNDEFSECKIKNCNFSSRHHGRDNYDVNDNKNVLDPQILFYAQKLDALHFYLLHLFECGLRVTTIDGKHDDDDEEEEQEDEMKGDQYFDAEFAKISRIISKRQHMTSSFDIFKKTKNKKFCINISNNNNINMVGSVDGETYLDELFLSLLRDGICSGVVFAVCSFLREEEFDTDSVDDDIDNSGDEENKYHGNIWQHISHIDAR